MNNSRFPQSSFPSRLSPPPHTHYCTHVSVTAPDDWWTRREDDEVCRSDDGSVEESGDAETMEIVDFRVVADDGDDGGK